MNGTIFKRFGDKMKKCEYCGKEISYFDQYCCDDCQRDAIKFYDFREKYTSIFSIINCISVFGIPVGIFIFAFAKDIGFTIATISLIVLGIMVMILPFPTENMLSKRKIKQSVKLTRILGLILFVLGIVCLVADFIFYL